MNLPCGHVMSHKKKLGPIGSSVFTFIGYKQPNRQTDKQTDMTDLYIDVVIFVGWTVCKFDHNS